MAFKLSYVQCKTLSMVHMYSVLTRYMARLAYECVSWQSWRLSNYVLLELFRRYAMIEATSDGAPPIATPSTI